ncbi:MAG TPA: M14 metallopeptidase family protein [Acidobacteriota bacterium]|nr:M14 metallopeptidase family protein [Acidobacteriota bacterium]
MVRRNQNFLSVLVLMIFFLGASVSFAQRIPPPEEILGFKVGADFHLATYQQAVKYFEELEKSSPMIKLFEMGKTEMGKPMIYAVITSDENMAKLDHYKEISKKLALVRDLTDEEACQLAAEGRAVVYIDGGLHASECAPAQHNIQLAYNLLTSDDPDYRLILDQTILLLVFANPDGMDMLAEWYHSNVGTPYEVSPMPWVYNKYVGHDNNRDSFMVNMAETKNITRLVNQEWFPVILYNHHQRGPFPSRIFIPPECEPTNPNVHPLIPRGKVQVGAGMGKFFDQENKPGAISRIVYDSWYPGYVSQNGIRSQTFCGLWHAC